jgi:hypothetical protein
MEETSFVLRIYGFVFQYAFFDEHDYIAEVYSTWTNQHTLATKHTFLNLRFEFDRFATSQKKVHSPDIKTYQIACAAGGSAPATRQAYLERWFHFENFIQ